MDAKKIIPFFTAAHDAKVKALKDSAAQFVLNAAEYTRIEKDYMAHAETAKKGAEVAKDKAAVLEKKTPQIARKAIEQARKVSHALGKHKGIASLTVSGQVVTIMTPLLFCYIRTAAGSKTSKRTCIGAFKCTLNFQDRAIKLENKVFRKHWAIDDHGRPCLGEFGDEVALRFSQNDIYGVWDVLYHLLMSADMDGAAFMRSHDWKDTYRTPETGARFATGQFVAAIADCDGMNTKGRTGIVLTQETAGQARVNVLFQAVPSVGQSFTWRMLSHLLVPISQKQFNVIVVYDVKIIGLNDKLDRMRSGTLKDYEALDRTVRAKLTPKA